MSNEDGQNAVVVERFFEVSASIVWKLWAEAEHFKKWYGPQGFSVPVAQIEAVVGGKRVVCMSSPDSGMKMWTAGEYLEVSPTKRLVYTEGFADENGNAISPASMGMEGHPEQTQVTVELEELDGVTKMVLIHAGVDPASGAAGGWQQAFDKLETYSKEIAAT